MTSFSTGRQAEIIAARYLVEKGYKIVEQNWRTRYCEIDIIASKDKAVYFVEVKYRQNNTQGGGLEYITASKLQQMTFASELWVHEHEWDDDYRLAAIEVSGAGFEVTNFISDLA